MSERSVRKMCKLYGVVKRMPKDAEILSAYQRITRTQAEPDAVNIALKAAKDKLAWIIGRYGDENGHRLTVEYIAQLVDEAVLSRAFEKSSLEYCKKAADIKKGRSTEGAANQEIIHCYYTV